MVEGDKQGPEGGGMCACVVKGLGQRKFSVVCVAATH